MTVQEAFTKIVTHLRRQGAPARDEHNHCRYRAEGDRMCAVGCLIPDEEYREEFEGCSVGMLALRWNIPALAGLDKYFLGRMQSIHDVYPVEHWETHFESVARDYRLELPAR